MNLMNQIDKSLGSSLETMGHDLKEKNLDNILTPTNSQINWLRECYIKRFELNHQYNNNQWKFELNQTREAFGNSFNSLLLHYQSIITRCEIDEMIYVDTSNFQYPNYSYIITLNSKKVAHVFDTNTNLLVGTLNLNLTW